MQIDLNTFILIASVLKYSTFLPLVFSFYKKHLPTYLSLLRLLIIISLVSSYLAVYLGELLGNSIYVTTIYFILEFLVINVIYYEIFRDSRIRRTLIIIGCIYIVVSIYSLIFLEGFYNFNSLPLTASSFLTIFYCIFYFWQLLRKLEIDNLVNYPMFWITSSILISASGNFLVFTLSSFLHLNYTDLFMWLWALRNILYILRNFAFAYAFWLNVKVT